MIKCGSKFCAHQPTHQPTNPPTAPGSGHVRIGSSPGPERTQKCTSEVYLRYRLQAQGPRGRKSVPQKKNLRKTYGSASFLTWPDVRTVDVKDTRCSRLWRSIAVTIFSEMAITPKCSEIIVFHNSASTHDNTMAESAVHLFLRLWSSRKSCQYDETAARPLSRFLPLFFQKKVQSFVSI